ncbi:hypothetical protein [Parasitella parasitica]|uniref:Zn(2)-C6 fungal-type domain-containing protein n=1 Tax=Parasitella parasitica TaxID=35722 RepID=A0A0B7NHI2_9FUNG|nr:hypothetical protein [Parasitella parasitica]
MSEIKTPEEREKQANLGAACFRCRGFRHACDRRKPSCSRCHRRGITCVYPEAAPTLKKLQKATETLGDRIKKFNDRLKSTDVAPTPIFNTHQSMLADHSSVASSPYSDSPTSTYSDDELSEEPRPKRKARRNGRVASTKNFSVYPCTKCFKDLQQCDLALPKCSRCEANNFECGFKKTEPKANHVSQVLNTMNKVMDQWQESIDRMAKDFAQKTRDLSARANHSLKIKPMPQTAWKITSTKKGLSVESNVNSYNDLSTLVDQFKRSMTISKKPNTPQKNNSITSTCSTTIEPTTLEFDDTRSVHTNSSFAVWNLWANPTHAMPQDYPIDISQELTDNLVDLYCRTPCCSSIRLPIIDTKEFLVRYHDPDPARRPSTILIYAVCAMAARNAFQLHVWSKRPSCDAPQYNMGKALSVAYCLRGRELLADCFDEPTFDNCQAAFLLSYCHYQNGYPGVIYFYEWIAYTMAQELGLYNPHRNLKPYESMLIWSIYYCNAWYKLLQGSDDSKPSGLSQCRPLLSTIPPTLPLPQGTAENNESALLDHYVWNTWVYLINLQVMREQSMVILVSHQGNSDLPRELLSMQATLEEFHSNLPLEWQSMASVDSIDMFSHVNSPENCCSAPSSPSSSSINGADTNYNVDIKSFARYCINLVSLHYSMNQIILHQPFVPMYRAPSTLMSIQSLNVSLKSANNITSIFEIMVHQKEECHVPLVGFLFANIVYRKLLSYTTDDHYYEIGRAGLLNSLDISKSSVNYTYDFELARTLVNLMEQDIQHIICQGSTNYMSMDSSSSAVSTQSPPTPVGQQYVNVSCPLDFVK